MTYAGVEALLVPWLTTTTGTRTVTDTPADLENVLPIHRVTRVGGPSDANNPRFDLPTVVVDSFAADRMAATTAALEVDDVMRQQLPGTLTGGAVVTRVETVTGPHWAPWDATQIRRFTATYRLHVKRQS